jgi:asparagine synthase (glutamine-hydrolysing)
MCGIAGVVTFRKNVAEILLKARDVQKHRGPDAEGFIQTRVLNKSIGLGHQRLSILDLSAAGNQPMAASNGLGWLVYNGEVYNYREIRADLEKCGRSFKSYSDTEVVLTALQEWGVEEALNRFNGMWAFAWLDLPNSCLVFARDRAGIKPIYILLSKEEIFFASEVKAILEMSSQKFSLNGQIIGEYLLQSQLDTGDETFFMGIRKIPAAHYGVLDLSVDKLSLQLKSYWTLPVKEQQFVNEENLAEEIRELFFDAVRLRLRSDVPVGVLLSGGVDSSSIASAVQVILGKNGNLNLLSAISNDPSFDESPFIDKMTEYLGCSVNKVVLDFPPGRAFELLEQVCWYNDEPVGSFSNVAHYLLMREARNLGITVVLSGQGADELLCGYKKYLGFYLQSLVRKGQFGKAFHEFWSFWRQGTVLSQFSIQEAKRYLPGSLKPSETDIRGPVLKDFTPLDIGLPPGMTVMERQALDIQRYSIPILTHYEDRMSMAWSREIRVPFLDYRLVEAMIPLPTKMKLHNGWTKWIFRKAMESHLPKEITWRKDKQSFVNPQEGWLREHLKQGVMDHFGEDSLIFRHQLVERRPLLSKYETYCRQKAGSGSIWFKDIFSPLALEIWLRKFEGYILS